MSEVKLAEKPYTILGLEEKNLSEIAWIIEGMWANVSPHARPYLSAMHDLIKITDNYMYDSGSSVVAYFLANASQFKGDVAREIKTELKRRLKNYYKNN